MDARQAQRGAAAFLAELPLTLQEDDRLYVHSGSQQSLRDGATCRRRRMPRAASWRHRAHDHILRPHPPAGALFDVVSREDDEFCADLGRPGATAAAAGAGWPCSARWDSPRDGDPAASFAMFDTEQPGNHLLPRAAYDVEAAAARIRENGLPLWLADRLLVGQVSDGQAFHCSRARSSMASPIGECVHRGGMATLWSVTHPGITVPLLMKVPRVSGRRGSGGHCQFRDGADDPAAAVGTCTCRPVSAPAISRARPMS